MTNEEKINLIAQKILLLSDALYQNKTELEKLQHEINLLKTSIQKKEIDREEIKPLPEIKSKEIDIPVQQPAAQITPIVSSTPVPAPKKKINIEEFIGGKIVSIIGITVLVIGIAIGVKYAIDNNLINPLTRIILGFIAGGILLLFALRLRSKFEVFSAILLSGAMATLYFTTYAGYIFYGLYPQLAAFMLMVLFTVFTVYAATVYNMEVIAIIGLVGAYCVPFMLSDNSGRVEILFSYMCIINAGILFLSFRKHWRILNQFAYYTSWVIFLFWFLDRYDPVRYQNIAVIFSFIFFITFYLNNIAYKTIRKEPFHFYDIVLVFSNSFVYYGIGYAIFNQIQEGLYLGAFTVGNAIVHFAFGVNVYRNKQVDRKLFFMLIGLVLTFLTIAVPVQLDGNWVTLFWAAEIFLLFFLGRKNNISFYEYLAYLLVLPAIISLVHDWSETYAWNIYSLLHGWKLIFNVTFLTSLLIIGSLTSLIAIHKWLPLKEEKRNDAWVYSIVKFAIPVSLFLVTYFTFCNEIANFFYERIQETAVKVPNTADVFFGSYDTTYYDYDLDTFRVLWMLNYSLLFVSVFAFLVIRKWKNLLITWISYGLNLLLLLIFISAGLFSLGEIRDSMFNSDSYYGNDYFKKSGWYFHFRYVCFVFVFALAWLIHKISKTDFIKNTFADKINPLILHFAAIVLLSNELTHLMIINHPEETFHYESVSYKVGYTILWGLYSFVLVAFGILRKHKLTRISAIALFGVTLLKLFTYDIVDLSTINKVIAFTGLGILLLVVSFLYQKFKHVIFGDDEK